MADGNGKVMEMVREELQKNPSITTGELFEKAKKLDKSVSGMSPRQFHARYPLQVKRQIAAGQPRRRSAAARARRRAAVDRSAVRNVLLQFAKDVAGAEEKSAVVDVIGGVDKYVDRVLQAAGVPS